MIKGFQRVTKASCPPPPPRNLGFTVEGFGVQGAGLGVLGLRV